MPSKSVAGPRACPIDRALRVVGDRWSLLVLREVMYGQRRFEQVAAQTGVPRDVLTSRLRKLVDEGLLEKRPYNAGATRFEYRLTGKGLALRPVIVALGEWGESQLPDVPVRWRGLATAVE